MRLRYRCDAIAAYSRSVVCGALHMQTARGLHKNEQRLQFLHCGALQRASEHIAAVVNVANDYINDEASMRPLADDSGARNTNKTCSKL